jgi:hypothetical protein
MAQSYNVSNNCRESQNLSKQTLTLLRGVAMPAIACARAPMFLPGATTRPRIPQDLTPPRGRSLKSGGPIPEPCYRSSHLRTCPEARRSIHGHAASRLSSTAKRWPYSITSSACGGQDVSRRQLARGLFGFQESRRMLWRQQLVRHFKRFCPELRAESTGSRKVSCRAIEARPSSTGSPPTEKMIGTVGVAVLAASVEGGPGATMTAAPCWTSSPANAGSRSSWLPAQRYSIVMFRPST